MSLCTEIIIVRLKKKKSFYPLEIYIQDVAKSQKELLITQWTEHHSEYKAKYKEDIVFTRPGDCNFSRSHAKFKFWMYLSPAIELIRAANITSELLKLQQDSFQGVSCALLKNSSCSQVLHVTDVLLLSQDTDLLETEEYTAIFPGKSYFF